TRNARTRPCKPGRSGRTVRVLVGGTRFPRSCDRAHIRHRPLLLRPLHGGEQVRNCDGRENADDRNDDEELDQGETFLLPCHSLSSFFVECALRAIEIPSFDDCKSLIRLRLSILSLTFTTICGTSARI